MSATFEVLLAYSKQSELEVSFDNIVKECLGKIYHPDMGIRDIIAVVSKEYQVLCSEPRFEVGTNHKSLDCLLLSPVVGYNSVELFGATTDSVYSVEEFYTSILKFMISAFRLSRVDWLKGETSDNIG